MDKLISTLLDYSFEHLGASKDDFLFLSNYLMATLDVKDFSYEQVDTSNYVVPDELTKQLYDRFIELGFDDKNANKKTCEVYGVLSPRPSEVRKNFSLLYEEDPKLATDYLFDLSIKNNYVQKTKIEQNVIINSDKEDGIIVTINLSKPEKNNDEIAKALKATSSTVTSNYPKCPICIENEGCYGSSKTEPRNNLRLIPFEFSNDTWYLQYSPYGYYNEHCILILKDHIPMEVNKTNARALFEFVDALPHYFIGANSDLPIVGGSILTHEHFQGGSFEMPLMKAKTKETIYHEKYTDLKFEILSWPSFVIKISGEDKDVMLDAIDEMYKKYLVYSDASIELINETNGVRHNTMTLIVEKKSNTYSAYVIYRNNRTNDEHKGGIFHVRERYQHIKNEGIGLIEAMGLFIFPARLKRQLGSVEEIIKNPTKRDEIIANSPDLAVFNETIDDLLDKKFPSIDEYLLHVGMSILEDISIVKYDKDGAATKKLLTHLGFKK